MRMTKKSIFTAILTAAVTAAVAIFAICQQENKKEIVYSEHLADTIAKIDGEKLTLREMAFYVAYEEMQVEEQARIYSPEDTNDYWNLHTDGQFVKVTAKSAALDMAVHDTLFYQLATEEELTLSEEEKAACENSASDFCLDLEPEQLESLGITEEDILASSYRLALSEKYQQKLSQDNDVEYAAFDIAGTWYARLKEEHKIKIYYNLWNRVPFGSVTLNH